MCPILEYTYTFRVLRVDGSKCCRHFFVLEYTYKIRVLRVDGSKCRRPFFVVYSIQMMQVVTKKSRGIFFRFKAFHFINLSCQDRDSDVLLGRVRKTSSRSVREAITSGTFSER